MSLWTSVQWLLYPCRLVDWSWTCFCSKDHKREDTEIWCMHSLLWIYVLITFILSPHHTPPLSLLQLYFTQVEMIAAFFLLLSLSCSLIFMSCLRFRMYRFYSLFLFSFYLVFLVVVILAEAQVFNIELAELSPLWGLMSIVQYIFLCFFIFY